MSTLVIVAPVPFIDTTVVEKGVVTAYVLEKNQSIGFNGTVSDVKAEEVTLTGYRGTVNATVKYTAAQLHANDYSTFRFAKNMVETQQESSVSWTKDVQMEIIDPNVCKPQYFIMYKQKNNDDYTNGLILSVEREKISVLAIVNSKSTTITLTIADIKKQGFSAEVSPVIESGMQSAQGTVEYL